MSEAVREMTFEEEYEILQRESKKVFGSEHEDCEPPLANCVLRRALRCIRKLQEQQPKTDCSECSRREFYQQGYQDGLNADKWIPCEERLPEDDDEEYYPMCLVTLDNGEVCTGAYRTNDKVWYTRMCEGETVYTKEHKVLAWQLLPQPYKEEGTENE